MVFWFFFGFFWFSLGFSTFLPESLVFHMFFNVVAGIVGFPYVFVSWQASSRKAGFFQEGWLLLGRLASSLKFPSGQAGLAVPVSIW